RHRVEPGGHASGASRGHRLLLHRARADHVCDGDLRLRDGRAGAPPGGGLPMTEGSGMRIGRRILLAASAAILASAPVVAADHLDLTMPRRMLADHTQTIEVEIKDSLGRVVTTGCPSWGSVSAKR